MIRRKRSNKFLSLPIVSQSLACSASTAGTLSLTEADAASSDRACSRRTEAAIELVPSTGLRREMTKACNEQTNGTFIDGF